MRSWWKDLDRILRGEATQLSALRTETIEVPAAGLSVVAVVLGMIYGACMGCYSIFGFEIDDARWAQLVASMVKVPALFFLTLLVTFPSLYVFNALVGSRLTVEAVLRLLIAAMGVTLAVLASLGPIVAFFSVNTSSYSFMVLLNVFVFTLSGGLGLGFLLQTLHRMSIAQRQAGPAPGPDVPSPGDAAAPSEEEPPSDAADGDQLQPELPPPANPPAQTEPQPPVEAQLTEEPAALEPGALDRIAGHVLGRHVKTVFACWVVVFGLVGAQMSWVLRPFIGDPHLPFKWFRPRESNFFEAVSRALQDLFS